MCQTANASSKLPSRGTTTVRQVFVFWARNRCAGRRTQPAKPTCAVRAPRRINWGVMLCTTSSRALVHLPLSALQLLSALGYLDPAQTGRPVRLLRIILLSYILRTSYLADAVLSDYNCCFRISYVPSLLQWWEKKKFIASSTSVLHNLSPTWLRQPSMDGILRTYRR